MSWTVQCGPLRWLRASCKGRNAEAGEKSVEASTFESGTKPRELDSLMSAHEKSFGLDTLKGLFKKK
jgi:hypothetical protein